jgi:hypothetical protein
MNKMCLLFTTLVFASIEAFAGSVTLHGRLLTRGTDPAFVYSESGQEKEIRVT